MPSYGKAWPAEVKILPLELSCLRLAEGRKPQESCQICAVLGVIRKPLVADGLNDYFKLLRAGNRIRFLRDTLALVRDPGVRRRGNRPVIQRQFEDVLKLARKLIVTVRLQIVLPGKPGTHVAGKNRCDRDVQTFLPGLSQCVDRPFDVAFRFRTLAGIYRAIFFEQFAKINRLSG